MATKREIMNAINGLRLAGLINEPKDDAIAAGIMKLWHGLFEDVTGDVLEAAIKQHLKNPENGRFWPTPAHLFAIISPKPTEAPGEAAWAAILARVASGVYTVGDLLTPIEMKALQNLGGIYPVRQAEEGPQLNGLKKRYLAEVARLSVSSLPAVVGSERRMVPS